MADPISLIASVVGVAAAGLQVANAVIKICDKLTQGPQEMRKVASGMRDLSETLEDVAALFEAAKEMSVYKPRVLQRTKSVLDRFDSLQDEVKNIIRRQHGMRGRVKWVFSASKVQTLLLEIEALKSGLSLMLWVVQFAMATTNPEKNEAKCGSRFGGNLRLTMYRKTRFRDLVETIMRENRLKVISMQKQPEASQATASMLHSPRYGKPTDGNGAAYTSSSTTKTDTHLPTPLPTRSKSPLQENQAALSTTFVGLLPVGCRGGICISWT